MISVSNLEKSFGDRTLFTGASFQLNPGERYGLVGANGSGKTTMLQATTGLLPVSAGEILVRSVPTFLGVQAVLRNQLTGRRNIEVGLLAQGLNRAAVEDLLPAVVEFTGLGDAIDMRMETYSSGMRARLHFAVATATSPEILLIDELSLGLAPTVVRDLLELIERLQERGQTIILVEQSLNVALSVADRAIFLEKGQVRFEGSAEDLLKRDDLARAVFLGRDGG